MTMKTLRNTICITPRVDFFVSGKSGAYKEVTKIVLNVFTISVGGQTVFDVVEIEAKLFFIEITCCSFDKSVQQCLS